MRRRNNHPNRLRQWLENQGLSKQWLETQGLLNHDPTSNSVAGDHGIHEGIVRVEDSFEVDPTEEADVKTKPVRRYKWTLMTFMRVIILLIVFVIVFVIVLSIVKPSTKPKEGYQEPLPTPTPIPKQPLPTPIPTPLPTKTHHHLVALKQIMNSVLLSKIIGPQMKKNDKLFFFF